MSCSAFLSCKQQNYCRQRDSVRYFTARRYGVKFRPRHLQATRTLSDTLPCHVRVPSHVLARAIREGGWQGFIAHTRLLLAARLRSQPPQTLGTQAEPCLQLSLRRSP